MTKGAYDMDNGISKLKLIETTASKTLSHNHLFDASSIEELQKEVQRILNNYDISDCAFACLPKKRLNVIGVFQTIPHEVYIDYVKKGYGENDILVQHCRKRDTPVFMADIYKVTTEPNFHADSLAINRAAYEYIADFGYLDCYNIPLYSMNDVDKVMISVTTKDMQPDKFGKVVTRHHDLIKFILQVIDYLWWTRFPNARVLKSVEHFESISPQTLHVFQKLVDSDKSVKQVADELNLALSTVNHHISVMKRALGTKTAYSTYRKAVNLGLIDFADD